MRILGIVRRGNWQDDDNDEEEKSRKKKSEDEVNRPSLMWHEECRTNSSSKLDNRETLTKHEYLS